ncbi:MAG: hypothetical protein ROW48_07855 [Bellilinea sp.]
MRDAEPKPPARAGGSTQTGGKPSQVYFTANGKIAAQLRGSVLRKTVRGSHHQLRKPPGWAIDLRILEQARQDGCRLVEIIDLESRQVYTAPTDAFDRHGIRLNRGFGEQVVLPMAHWSTRDARQPTLFSSLEALR